MSATLEIVMEQVKTLSETERATLIEVLRHPPIRKNGTVESRRAKIKAFQKRFRGMLPSTEEFMAEKRKEVELEERKWRS